MFNLKYRPHYFSYHLNREVEEVYWHAVLNGLALSMVFIFEPIYLWSLGYSLIQILWFYVQVYVWYALLVSFGAKFASRYGYKHAILVANIFYVIYWGVLFSVKAYPFLFFVAPVFFALQKSWFWPAYDADVALSAINVQRGREMGMLYSLIQFSFIIGPFIGGFISHNFGFSALFVSAAFVMLFSAYPLFRSKEIHSEHEFKFRSLLRVFRDHPRNFFGYWGYAEDLMIMSLWPVYMSVIVPHFFNLGVVSTIATIAGTMLMLYIGRLTDKVNKLPIIRWSALVYGVTWLFRPLANSLGSILVFDSLTKAGKDVLNVPMMALTFERAGNRKADYAIAYSVFYEFSLAVGKIITALAGILILSQDGSIFTVFAVAGVLTWFYALLK